MRGDTISGLEKYLKDQIESVQKGIASFRDRLETHPVWALEGVESVMTYYQTVHRANEVLGWCATYREYSKLPEDDENRVRYTAGLNGAVMGTPEGDAAFLDKVESYLLKGVIDGVRTGCSLSTSPGANLKREVAQIVDATFLDSRKWGYWSRA